jgi:UDP-glucose 4-epimerase
MKPSIIITGANGFIGRHLVRCLQERGTTDITAIFRNRTVLPQLRDISIVNASFADAEKMKAVIRAGSTVIHCACSTFPTHSECDTEKDIEENVVGTLMLLRICREKRVEKFIFLSSGGTVYGDCGSIPIPESTPLSPMNSHGVMKTTIEHYLRVYHRMYDVPYLILRIGNAYGNDSLSERPQGFIDAVVRAAVLNQDVEIWGNGAIVRDYVFIDDICDALVKATEGVKYNETVNIGSGRGTSILDTMACVTEAIGRHLTIRWCDPRPFDLPCNILDISKAAEVLSWKPATFLPEGIRKTYDRLIAGIGRPMA